MPVFRLLTISLLVGLATSTALAAPPRIRLITEGSEKASISVRPIQIEEAILARAVAPSRRVPSDHREALVLRDTLWSHIAAQQALDPRLLYAVALEETRSTAGPSASRPWPFTLRGPDGPQFHPTRADAARALRQLLERHAPRAIDVGLMQINLHWHGERVPPPEQLLDPGINLAIGARILAEAIRSAPDDLVLGIGRYHQWRDEAIARAYGQRVIRLAEAL